jgi:hypothetical protein
MDVWQSSLSGGESNGASGPDCDALAGPRAASSSQTLSGQSFRIKPFVAVATGVLAALLVARIGSAHVAEPGSGNRFSPSSIPAPAMSAKDLKQLAGMTPQQQAETLLELAVGESDGAVEQIESRANGWPGKLKWTTQIASLSSAALNSSDMRVRESGVEIELAAYGLGKNSASLNYLLKTAASSSHAQKVWALWALGLMGNRGVETDRIVQVLTAQLDNSDEELRRWAIEGLALVGRNQTIAPLLKAMHDDPAPDVRERAACGLAQSGMFTSEQRQSALPQLLQYTDDPALDAQTHDWAFQALTEITGQRLPHDSAAWRSWYDSTQTQ